MTLDDGVIVPSGKATEIYGLKSELQYNEYIVYDTAQVKNRFLLRVKFDFKR